MPEPDKRATADRLRDDIDRGRTGDKVPFQDPAAAPLGTDDEAAGTPITQEQAATAQRYETGTRPSEPPRPARDTVAERQRTTLPMRSVLWLVALVIVGVLIVALAF